VGYIAHIGDFGWSLEGATEGSEDLETEVSNSWRATTCQHPIDAYSELDVFPLSLGQVQEMDWQPY
jgi:hypothetical protein